MKNTKSNIIGLSMVAALVLGTSAYAGTITGATAGDIYQKTTPPSQFGFGGWNLSNVDVQITDTEDNPLNPPKTFDKTYGTYDVMTYGDSFVSEILDSTGKTMGRLHGKDWPVGEPAGIKVINGDTKVNNGKPENCIMTTSFLSADDTGTGVSGYLDAAQPVPTICSSPFQTHKRFKINMQPSTVAGVDATTGGFGQPIDIVFNVTNDGTSKRYQVFQKINNYTGVRLDGYKVEILDANDQVDENLTISLGLGENDGGDIWAADQMANFSSGLWGPLDPSHDRDEGFFDNTDAGLYVNLTAANSVESAGALGSNYTALFGKWLTDVWSPQGWFYDDDVNPTTDAVLVAFYGTTPTQNPFTDTPAWHKGQKDNWTLVTPQELLQWKSADLYAESNIEDTLNLGLNYIVEIGAYAQATFKIRITPKVAPAVDQVAPSYIGTPSPPIEDLIPDGTVSVDPAPTFIIGDVLTLGVKDLDQNLDPTEAETTTVTISTDSGDIETVTLTEDGLNSAFFKANIPTELITSTSAVPEDGKISVVNNTEVSVIYHDNDHDDKATTIATLPVDDTNDAVDTSGDTASSGGGGCTSNPNAKSFDMMFLFMMALGLLYPFRRRFIK